MRFTLPKIPGSKLMSQFCFSLSASNGERVGVRCRKRANGPIMVEGIQVGATAEETTANAREPGVFGEGADNDLIRDSQQARCAHSCSMKITEDVRKYAAEQGISEEEARMVAKSKEFVEKSAEGLRERCEVSHFFRIPRFRSPWFWICKLAKVLPHVSVDGDALYDRVAEVSQFCLVGINCLVEFLETKAVFRQEHRHLSEMRIAVREVILLR